MSGPGLDLFKDLAIAQASPGTPIDSVKAEAIESRTFRRRIAAFAWIPGLAVVLTLAGWSGNAVAGVAGLVVLLVALFLYAERGDRFAALIRGQEG